MVRKITCNYNIAVIDRTTASRPQSREEFSVAVRLRVIFIAWNQRAGAQRNAENMIREIDLLRIGNSSSHFVTANQPTE